MASGNYDEARQTLGEWSRMFPGASDLMEAKATLDTVQQKATTPLPKAEPSL
jgi:hypothetical protein